jgi:hypothetical protein
LEPVTVGLIEQAETWLRANRARQAVDVTYRRGSDSATVPALPARTRWQTDAGEIFLDSTHADFLIERAELVLGLLEVLPEPGDMIELTLDHGVDTYEVATLGTEPCFKYHGRDGGTFRVHAVRIPTDI